MTYPKGKSGPKEEETEEYADHSESGRVRLAQKSKLCGFLKMIIITLINPQLESSHSHFPTAVNLLASCSLPM